MKCRYCKKKPTVCDDCIKTANADYLNLAAKGASEAARFATVGKIAEAYVRSMDIPAGLEDARYEDNAKGAESALWALLGGRPEQRKVQEVRRGIRFHEMSMEESSGDDGEAWHCSQCGSVICVDPDTGGPICPQCKTSPMKREG